MNPEDARKDRFAGPDAESCPTCGHAKDDPNCQCQPLMPRSEWEARIRALVDEQTERLDALVADGTLSKGECLQLTLIISITLPFVVKLTDKAWEMFIRIANESRETQNIPHENKP